MYAGKLACNFTAYGGELVNVHHELTAKATGPHTMHDYLTIATAYPPTNCPQAYHPEHWLCHIHINSQQS
eukprot:scaffold128850_cov27-Prasinocladus_malaysianus.AAC.2